MIQVNKVTKTYSFNVILDKITFEVEQGEIVGLLGPNGAGKSTLLSIMATIVPPTSGDVYIDGDSVVKRPNEVRKKIGYVPQEIALYTNLSVIDNLRFWSTMSAAKVSEDKIEQMLDTINLTHKKKEKLSTLSGGMQRRVNLAVALLHDPTVLIMDEPTVGIDIESKQEMNQLIKDLSSHGKTIVYTSHDPQEIQFLCHRVVKLGE